MSEEASERETLGVDDLDRVYFRAQDEQGRWVSINAQFDRWARSRAPVADAGDTWRAKDRAGFCNMLWQANALHILKKDVDLNELDIS